MSNPPTPPLRTPQQRAEFEASCLPHLDGLYGAALRMARDPSDAEDLVQDALVRAYRFYDRFEQGTNIKAWLYKILTNTFINSYRRRNRERNATEGSEKITVSTRSSSTAVTRHSRDPESNIMDGLISKQVLAALDALPIDFRIVVILADLQDFAYKEIAEIVGCPVGTVMSRLFRGRRLLRGKLEDYAIERGVLRASTEQSQEMAAKDASASSASVTQISKHSKYQGGHHA